MTDYYRPTTYLRFVERPQPDMLEAMNGRSKIRVLQQLWRSDIVGEQDIWRDVPLHKEGTGG